jgi:predicted signal transduction protein with EAL and GGDEF domain
MSGLKTIKQFFAVPDDPHLVQAQARAFTRQVPLMYDILLVNSLVLAACCALLSGYGRETRLPATPRMWTA